MIYRVASDAQIAHPKSLSGNCPSCRHFSIFVPIANNPDVIWTNISNRVRNINAVPTKNSAGIRMCPNVACEALIFIIYRDSRIIESFPSQSMDFDSSNLPDEIVLSLDEAIKCHSVGAHKASTLMIRRLLEELCDIKGATGSDLKNKLAALSDNIVVPKELLDAADELRILGNDAAHVNAKGYDSIGSEESELAIILAKELLKAVYQYSAILDKLKGLRKSPP